MSAEVWDQASGQNHVPQVENQFFDLALSQQEAHPPCPSCASLPTDKKIVNLNRIVNWWQ